MNYLVPLILTIIIELAVVYLLGIKDNRLLVLVIIANILTNPLLNFVVRHHSHTFMQIICLEVIVVITECVFLKYTNRVKLPYFRLAFIMNAVSYLIGLWLPWNLIGRLYL